MKPYYYLLINLGSIIFPFLLSFDKKVAFYKQWYRVWPSIIAVACFFIAWDMWFTRIGIWSFNPNYLTGIYIGNLPIEECLFFITIPYSCLFVYEVLKAYLTKDYFSKSVGVIHFLVIAVQLVVLIAIEPRWYTSVALLLNAAALYGHLRIWGQAHLGWFYQMYIVHLIPFYIVNGILTSIPIVMYNDAENLGIRVGTIPIEDHAYSMVMLMLVVSMYEWIGQSYRQRL